MKSEEAKVKFTNFIEQVKNLSTANKNIFHNFHHCVNSTILITQPFTCATCSRRIPKFKRT